MPPMGLLPSGLHPTLLPSPEPAKRYGCCTGNQAAVAEMGAGCSRPAKIFPSSLALLFGGDINKPVEKPQPKQFTREALMMEVLAAEESDEAPDDGALSSSGDEFEM
ncbi:hypothetical protein B0H13DRAFT_2300805 [Mycena leptocephala]|nr:hypothetical protein B0H13DRAFT_2300805 [Mycena leptocephala]